jgi:hypothetical protein
MTADARPDPQQVREKAAAWLKRYAGRAPIRPLAHEAVEIIEALLASSAPEPTKEPLSIESIAAFIEGLRAEFVSQLMPVQSVARKVREHFSSSPAPDLHQRSYNVVQAWVQGVHDNCEPCHDCLATLHKAIKEIMVAPLPSEGVTAPSTDAKEE